MKFACEVCWDYECDCTDEDIKEHRVRSKGKVEKPLPADDIYLPVPLGMLVKDRNHSSEWKFIPNN